MIQIGEKLSQKKKKKKEEEVQSKEGRYDLFPSVTVVITAKGDPIEHA